MPSGPNQTAAIFARLQQLEHDVTLLARAISHLLNVPGAQGSWSTTDFAALSETVDRHTTRELERGDEPYRDPTDWEAQTHDDPRPALDDEQLVRAAEFVSAIERDYPHNALTSALAGQAAGTTPTLCGHPNPAGTAVCVRAHGHGITAMRLPNGRRTYVDHNTRRAGTGEGWSG